MLNRTARLDISSLDAFVIMYYHSVSLHENSLFSLATAVQYPQHHFHTGSSAQVLAPHAVTCARSGDQVSNEDIWIDDNPALLIEA